MILLKNTVMYAARRLTSVRPSPPAAAQSNPVWTLSQFVESDTDTVVEIHERGEVTAFLETPVPRVVPRRILVAVEDVTRPAFGAVLVVVCSVLASCHTDYIKA